MPIELPEAIRQTTMELMLQGTPRTLLRTDVLLVLLECAREECRKAYCADCEKLNAECECNGPID